jgi:glyoxalase family protein
MPSLLGLHHVTATVDDAVADLAFARDRLGLRLVKKTVNFDNHFVYHFYYGDERGTPGSIWTTFPYRGWRVPLGVKGAGQIVATAFSVPEGSLDAWRNRLSEAGVTHRDGEERFGAETLVVDDPSGLVMELVVAQDDTRAPAPGGQGDTAVRGLHSVTLSIRTPAATIAFLTDILRFEPVAEEGGRTRLAVGGQGAGHLVEVVPAGSAPQSLNGLGTVHHVAWGIGTPEEQLAIRQELLERGVSVTEVRDRQYFTSIYFRIPGGVLFEIATVRPGFTVDEPLAELGSGLKLPPWEEPHRAEIEARLPRIG